MQKDTDTEPPYLLHYTEERWLIFEKVPSMVFGLRKEIHNFLESRKLLPFLSYDESVRKFAFAADITGHLNISEPKTTMREKSSF